MKTANVSGKISTKQPKNRVGNGFFNVDDISNWIVNDGKGTVVNPEYYKRNNWWKKNKKING
jgi:hypothetical protein